jgi:uncharacterized membrane protein YcjF (UPF0283 family)
VAVLGLILLAAAGVLTAAVVTSNTDSLTVDLWNASMSNVTLGVVFVAGMITTVVAVVGLGMLMGGVRRNRRLRKERRTLRRENEQLVQRVDATPDTTGPVARHNEYAPDTRSDDHPRVDSTAPAYVEDAEGSTAATGRRSFLSRRGPQAPTETVSRDV